jgi:hypothetical protein
MARDSPGRSLRVDGTNPKSRRESQTQSRRVSTRRFNRERSNHVLRLRSVAAAASCLQLLACELWGQQVRHEPLRAPDGTLDEGFSRIVGIRELSDGRVLVLDRSEQRIAIVNFRTREIQDIGRSGTGPGEYTRIEAFHSLPVDTTLVEDRGGKRWLLLDADRIIATVSWATIEQTISIAGGDRRGQLLDLHPYAFRRSPGVPYTPMRSNADSVHALLRHRHPADRNTKHPDSPARLTSRVDTVARLRGMAGGQTLAWRDVPPPRSRWLLENPLAAEEQALLFADGWVAFALTEPYRVDWLAPNGERVRGSPLPFAEVRLDDPAREAIIAWKWPLVRPPFTDHELPPWPRVLPPFLNDALLAAADGRLAIRRTYNPSVGATQYDLVDRAGKLAARIQLSQSDRLVGFGARSVYSVKKDRDDVEWLLRHPWP